MGAFRFRLEKVLRLRQREEDEAGRALAVLLSKRVLLLRRIQDFQAMRIELTERRRSLQIGEVRVAELSENTLRLDALGRGEARARGELREMDRLVDLQRRELLERRRKRKVLSELRERRLEEHRLEESRRELREADDRPKPIHGMGIA